METSEQRTFGASAYLPELHRKREAEKRYWDRPELQGPEGLPSAETVESKEIDAVRQTIQQIEHCMHGESIRNKDGLFRQMVSYGDLYDAYTVLLRYEKLLAKEPLVEEIANMWRKAGAFDEGPESVI